MTLFLFPLSLPRYCCLSMSLDKLVFQRHAQRMVSGVHPNALGYVARECRACGE